MAAINYFSEKIRFKLEKPRKTSLWVQSIVKKERRQLTSINYIFCSDEYLKGINTKYLKHKTYTDIVTFNYNPSESEIAGDIFISIDRVRQNAKTFKADFDCELKRVMIHGVLHLIGFNDKSKADKILMRKKEDSCLSLWK